MQRRASQDILDVIRDFLENPTERNQVELSDYAVNTLRDHARKSGWDKPEFHAFAGVRSTQEALVKLIREENTRIHNAGLRAGDATKYLRVRRAGSHFRLSRLTRYAVWGHLLSKGMLKGSPAVIRRIASPLLRILATSQADRQMKRFLLEMGALVKGLQPQQRQIVYKNWLKKNRSRSDRDNSGKDPYVFRKRKGPSKPAKNPVGWDPFFDDSVLDKM